MDIISTVFLGQHDPSHQHDLFESVETEISARVLLFNDEVHTFDEVIGQIIKATGCSPDRAEALTLQVHHFGKAIVYDGEMSECLRVSGILEEIALHTQVLC